MNESSTDQKFEYEDIGPKTISYLTEGLYPDARDPIREYVQNAVESIENFRFSDKGLEGDGTQAELTGIRSELKHLFSKGELSEYLTNTLPFSCNSKIWHADKIDKRKNKKYLYE